MKGYVLALALLAVMSARTVRADGHITTIDWAIPAEGGEIDAIEAHCGDTITFEWIEYHNVAVANSYAYTSCDVEDASVEILMDAGAGTGGSYTYTVGDHAHVTHDGTEMFLCEVGDQATGHCSEGQKIRIEILDYPCGDDHDDHDDHDGHDEEEEDDESDCPDEDSECMQDCDADLLEFMEAEDDPSCADIMALTGDDCFSDCSDCITDDFADGEAMICGEEAIEACDAWMDEDDWCLQDCMDDHDWLSDNEPEPSCADWEALEEDSCTNDCTECEIEAMEFYMEADGCGHEDHDHTDDGDSSGDDGAAFAQSGILALIVAVAAAMLA